MDPLTRRISGFHSPHLALRDRLPQEALGPSQPFVSDLERGMKSPSLEKIHELASSLGVHPSTLFVYSYFKAGEAKESAEDILVRVQDELGTIGLSSKKG